MRRARRRHYAALVIALTLVGQAAAEPPRAPGSNTGDGSTPFTGLARAPEANLFVGGATTSIPIEVPPGRKELTPKVALTYNSSGGPSPYGFGWDLPLGQIQRSTRHGVLSCSDPTYRNDFVLVLPEATVECTLNPDTASCNAAVEASFLRIRYWGPNNTWEVWDKSGLHYVFGELETARTGSGPSDLFTSAYPCTYTFSWALNRIEDPNGNYLDISYLKENGVLYPDSIHYGGNLLTGLAHTFEIKFGWGPRFPDDEIVNGLGGFGARLTNLLWEIDVRYLISNRLVRWYSFDYGSPTPGRQSHLSAVTLYDDQNHALARRDGLPAQTTFLYQDNTPARFGFGPEPQHASRLPLDGYFVPGRISGSGHTFRDIFDIDGDGIPDLIDAFDCDVKGYWSVYLGTAKGFSLTPIQWQLPSLASCWIRFVNEHSQTLSDTLDINGDGIPDLVSAETAPWTVYLGHVGGFDPTPTTWSAPLPFLRRSVGNVTITNGALGTIDVQDLIDMNGDGLLDLVSAPGTGVRWRVWYNTGSGFEPGLGDVFDTPSSAAFLRFTEQRSGAQMIGVYDINGDGLPDHVIAYGASPNSWYVFLNTGHAMSDTAETWTFAATACGRQGLQAPLSPVDRHVVRDLFDINGDGLPDLIDVCGWSDTNRSWQVFLNTGAGFSSSSYPWPSPSSVIRDFVQNPYGMELTSLDTFDLDGDGRVDFIDFSDPDTMLVYHNTGGAWCPSSDGSTCSDTPGASDVAANLHGTRPDLLQQIENGIGGTTHLEYRPSTQWRNTNPDGTPSLPFVMWTLTHIEQDDGLCDETGAACVSAGSHTLTKDLRYAYGLFDPGTREFRGFGTVEQYDSDGNLQTTWFRQDAARKGKVYAANSYAADATNPYNNLLVYTCNFWDCADPLNGQLRDCPQSLAPGQRWWVRLREADRYDTRNYTLSKLAFNRNAEWDGYGNVTHAVRGGTGTTSVHTYTSYALRNDAFGYIAAKPMHTLVTDDVVREEKWFTYDNLGPGQVSQGNVTAVSTWLDQVVDAHLPAGGSCPQPPSTGTGTCITTQMGYDALGNLIVATDAANRSTVTTYDDATQIYPYTVTNAVNQQVATLYDPGCGKLLWQTVTYAAGDDPMVQARTEHRYDAFCRLHATALPDEILARPHRTFDYFLGAPQHATEVRSVEAVAGAAPRAARWVTRHELFDALGRHLQTQRNGVVDGKRTTVVEGTVTFDGRGNPLVRYAPFLKAPLHSQAVTPYAAAPDGIGFTTLSYDPLNRVTQIINPDGSVRTMEHTVAWQTTTKDECYTAQTCPSGQMVEKRDAFGRVIEKQAYSGDTFETRTGYTYDGLGRLLTTAQGTTLTEWVTETTISLTYDSLGRKIWMSDPDSGTWRYGYDLAGNLIFQDDPKSNQHMEFCYDAINRVTDKFYSNTRDGFGPSHCGTVRGEIAYNYDEASSSRCPRNSCPADHCGLGRLTSVAERSGGSTMLCYDARGRTAGVITGISASGLTTVGQTSFTYDVADHVTSMTYPDGEKVRYEYDAVGQVKGLNGAQRYIRNLTYDVFGRPRMLAHGNRTIDTLTYYNQTSNFRLAAIETTTSRRPLLSYAYTSYGPTGLLTQLTDNGPKGVDNNLDNTATFTYDALARLTGVDGPNLPYANGYAHDVLGNIKMKEGTALTYSATWPHRLEAINGNSTGIAHDANGNRSAKPGHTYDYDADDRLIEIDVGDAATVSFVYDYTGHRVTKINGASVTRYYGRWAEAGDGYLTKYYFAAGLLVASQRIPNTDLAAQPPDPAVQLAGDPGGHALRLVVLLRPDVRAGFGLITALGMLALLSVPGRRKPVVGIAIRRGPVVVLIIAFSVVSLPLPIAVQPATAYQKGIVIHYHLDHLGSTQLITDSRGAVVAHIRYKPYGEVRGYYTPDGQVQAPDACGGAPSCREFTGYDTEPASGLQYAGARFYDPALGMFLTHDPGRQFANPYSYGNGDPVNWTDPNGEFFDELLAAVLIAALFSAAVNVVVAAAEGASLRQIGKAAAVGAATGAVGVGLGVLASGVNAGLASLAGTLPQDVTLNEALNALGEVAYRSAFSTVAANAAGQTATAAGAPSGLVTGLSIAAGYAASYGFDQAWLEPSGNLAKIESKGEFQQVSNAATHSDTTRAAAVDAGFTESDARQILAANLAEDNDLINNQSHFGFSAQDAFKTFERAAREASATGNAGSFVNAVGQASHYLQDQFALGHIFPGTDLFKGLAGAPFRALIHQTFGGDISFAQGSYNASLRFFEDVRSLRAL